MKEQSSSSGFVFTSVLFSIFLAFILWLMESLTVFFWFSEGSDKGFSAALFPFDDSAELLSRFIIAFTVITMGMVVGIVVQQINSNRRFLHTTLNSIGDGVITVNEGGAVLGMNPVAEDLVGWSFQEAGYRKVSDLCRLVPSDHRDGQCSDLFERIIEYRQTIRHSKDVRLIDRSGAEYEVELTVSPMVGPSGKHIGNVIVIRDISELKEMEEKKEKLLEELHQSQKMDAIGQLAGGIAHDFNNVLGGFWGRQN